MKWFRQSSDAPELSGRCTLILLALALAGCPLTPTKPDAPQTCDCPCQHGGAAKKAPSCAGDPLEDKPNDPQH
jgi:hypothetical protein